MYKLELIVSFKNNKTIIPLPYTYTNTNKPMLFKTQQQASAKILSLINTQHPNCVQKAIIKTGSVLKVV